MAGLFFWIKYQCLLETANRLRPLIKARDFRVIADLPQETTNSRPTDSKMLGQSLVSPFLDPAQTCQLH